jgi:hypothetical protein
VGKGLQAGQRSDVTAALIAGWAIALVMAFWVMYEQNEHAATRRELARARVAIDELNQLVARVRTGRPAGRTPVDGGE